MFKHRHYTKEMLDEENIPKHLLFRNLKELETINTLLGGHNISIGGLKKVLKNKTKTYKIADVGCGGGDSIKAMSKFTSKQKIKANYLGIDLKKDCIEYSTQNCKNVNNLTLYKDDFRNVFTYEKGIDIVHASLFCHHFTEDEIAGFIKDCSQNGSIFIINDLERNPLAHYSIKWLTKLFSKSPLVKNDAPLSVLRGFKKKEWEKIIQSAGIKKYTIQWKWAFRHLVIIYPNE
jgi:SAM-dependent methyltransferase